jgi:hypothetical protein
MAERLERTFIVGLLGDTTTVHTILDDICVKLKKVDKKITQQYGWLVELVADKGCHSREPLKRLLSSILRNLGSVPMYGYP